MDDVVDRCCIVGLQQQISGDAEEDRPHADGAGQVQPEPGPDTQVVGYPLIVDGRSVVGITIPATG